MHVEVRVRPCKVFPTRVDHFQGFVLYLLGAICRHTHAVLSRCVRQPFRLGRLRLRPLQQLVPTWRRSVLAKRSRTARPSSRAWRRSPATPCPTSFSTSWTSSKATWRLHACLPPWCVQAHPMLLAKSGDGGGEASNTLRPPDRQKLRAGLQRSKLMREYEAASLLGEIAPHLVTDERTAEYKEQAAKVPDLLGVVKLALNVGGGQTATRRVPAGHVWGQVRRNRSRGRRWWAPRAIATPSAGKLYGCSTPRRRSRFRRMKRRRGEAPRPLGSRR